MITLSDRLLQAADLLPPGSSITLSIDAIRSTVHTVHFGAAAPADLTVDQVAERMGRKPSTVRGWLAGGDLQGYKLQGRDWRVTEDALRRFVEKQKEPKPAERPNARTGKPADLGAWRKQGRAAA